MLTPNGELRSVGSGSATVIITGNIVDLEERPIGDLYEIQNEAITAWEGMLRSLGVQL